jgi:SAM-dependent methyltransferase
MMQDYFSPKYIEKQYDEMAQSYNDHRHLFDNSSQLEELGKLVSKGDKVLDAGCGSGIPAAEYFVELGCEVVGVDISGKMIELAEINVPGGEFYKADLLDIEYPRDHFDMIISFYCIFHIKKKLQGKVFKEFYDLLKLGDYSYFTLAGKGYTKKASYEGVIKFGDHLLPYAHFTEEEYRQMLTDENFDIISMQNLTIGGETMLWVLVRK